METARKITRAACVMANNERQEFKSEQVTCLTQRCDVVFQERCINVLINDLREFNNIN